jgi:hypothetical protein
MSSRWCNGCSMLPGTARGSPSQPSPYYPIVLAEVLEVLYPGRGTTVDSHVATTFWSRADPLFAVAGGRPAQSHRLPCRQRQSRRKSGTWACSAESARCDRAGRGLHFRSGRLKGRPERNRRLPWRQRQAHERHLSVLGSLYVAVGNGILAFRSSRLPTSP